MESITSHTICNVIECCGIELIDHNLIIICFYRVPVNTKHHFNLFYESLHDILFELCYKMTKNIVICGDFNIDILENTIYTKQINNLLASFNLITGINEPTRLCSGKCIDNIFHNIQGSKASVIEYALSDHTAQLLKCPVKRTYSHNYWYKLTYDLSKQNMIKFRDHLNSIHFSDVYSTKDPNSMFNMFYDIFKLLYDLCFPTKKVKIHSHTKPKWISRGIKLCCKKKRRCYGFTDILETLNIK